MIPRDSFIMIHLTENVYFVLFFNIVNIDLSFGFII